MITKNELLSLLDAVKCNGGGQYSARCPSHNDDKPSLSLNFDGEKIAMHCQAGCHIEDVCKALGIKLGDLSPERAARREIKALYNYADENGKLVFQVIRYDPKGFSQRRPDGGGGWVYNLKDTRRVLYKLPELIASDPKLPVFLVEGERDAETLQSIGLTATCGSGGAGKWRSDYNVYLRDRRVVVIVDNDDPGRQHVLDIYGSLKDTAAQLKFIYFDGKAKGYDVTDWIRDGGNKDELFKLAASSPEKPITADYSLGTAIKNTLQYNELVRQGRIGILPTPWPTLSDAFGGAGIPMGTVGVLVSLTGVGKSWLCYHLALHATDPEADREPIPTFICNTEMNQNLYVARLAAILDKNPLASLQGNSRFADELSRSLANVGDRLRQRKLEITDTENYTAKSVIRLFEEKVVEGFKFIILDHLGEVDVSPKKEYEEFPRLVKQLRDLARQNHAIILVVSHLRRDQNGNVDLAYAKRIQVSSDFVLGFNARPVEAVDVSMSCGTIPVTINRVMRVMKNRLGISDVNIGFYFDEETLGISDVGKIKAGA